MPAPVDCKMGTRVHDNYEDQYDEEIPEVDKCPECNHFAEVEELQEYDGMCYNCSLDQAKEESDEVSEV